MNRFDTLWNAWQNGTLQPAEIAELKELLYADDSALGDKIDELLQQETLHQPAPGEKELILQQVLQQINTPPAKVRTLPFRKAFTWAAAILLLLAGAGTYLFLNSNRAQNSTAVTTPVATTHDVAPGKDGAILTLADGKTVTLDSAGNGTIATQGNTTIELKNGQLIYKGDNAVTAIAYNTMTTPRGRQFSLLLPDGSKVWLNAASSLTYPTAFAGNERQVTITGEAYFEVAKDKSRPFKVKAGETTIEVTGTHFNVNAYADEAGVNTTLLEGGVAISHEQQRQLLAPGQAAIVHHNGSIEFVPQAPTEQAVAWKNGTFNFHKADVPAVMRQLARWYDVEVVYPPNIPNRLFGGEMERSLQLWQVLHILARMNINCKIEGNKLIVQPS